MTAGVVTVVVVAVAVVLVVLLMFAAPAAGARAGARAAVYMPHHGVDEAAPVPVPAVEADGSRRRPRMAVPRHLRMELAVAG